MITTELAFKNAKKVLHAMSVEKIETQNFEAPKIAKEFLLAWREQMIRQSIEPLIITSSISQAGIMNTQEMISERDRWVSGEAIKAR